MNVPGPRLSQIITRRSAGWVNGSARKNVASASGEDGAVGADAERQGQHRHRREAGRAPQLPQREPDVGPPFLEPCRQSHLTIPPSRNLHAGPPDALDVGRIDRLALAAAHLEVEGQLLLDFLLDRHTPQPRPQGSPHWAKSSTTTSIAGPLPRRCILEDPECGSAHRAWAASEHGTAVSAGEAWNQWDRSAAAEADARLPESRQSSGSICLNILPIWHLLIDIIRLSSGNYTDSGATTSARRTLHRRQGHEPPEPPRRRRFGGSFARGGYPRNASARSTELLVRRWTVCRTTSDADNVPPPRTWQILVSSIVDVDAVGPEDGQR